MGKRDKVDRRQFLQGSLLVPAAAAMQARRHATAAGSGPEGNAAGAMPAAPQGETAGKRYELSNANVRLVLDKEGRLVELTNRQTRNNYLAKGGRHAPWRMYYRWNTPLDGALELEIPTDGQKGRVTRKDNRLEISYETLTGNVPQRGKTRELQIGLLVWVALEGDRLVWTARINNREKDKELQVSELWLPWIYGLGNMGMGPGADVLYWPERGGRRITAPYNKLMAAAGSVAEPMGFGANPTWSYSDTGAPDYRLAYPYPACMQWFTISNGKEGLYFGSHDKTLMTTVLNLADGALKSRISVWQPRRALTDDEKVMAASITKLPFVQGGETWDSEPAVMRLYRGDWHEAAKTYRAWAETWMQKPDAPQWVRRTPGWSSTSIKDQAGWIFDTYAKLPGMLKTSQAVGINLLRVAGWMKQGFDDYYPEYDTDEAMGGEAGLKKALAEIKKAGGRSLLYLQGRLIDPAAQWYRNGGRRFTIKDIWGYQYLETYFQEDGRGDFMGVFRNKWFAVACPAAPGWIDVLVSRTKMVLGFGAQGIWYDQLGGGPPYPCFSKEHNHSKPSLAVGPWKLKVFQRLREVIKAHDPDAVLSNELVVDCYAGWADIVWSEGIGFFVAPESFGEMFRYTFPDFIVTNRQDGPHRHDPKTLFGQAFSLGLRLDDGVERSGGPDVVRFTKRIVELYTTHASLLLEGRFVDNEGFLCDNDQVSSHAFLVGDRMAVTLWNPTQVAQRARVVAPGYQFEAAEWQDPSWSGPDHWIMPGDVALLIFRRA